MTFLLRARDINEVLLVTLCGSPSPRTFGVVVRGVFGGCFGVLVVFMFAFVCCLVLYCYWIAIVLLQAVRALGRCERLVTA